MTNSVSLSIFEGVPLLGGISTVFGGLLSTIRAVISVVSTFFSNIVYKFCHRENKVSPHISPTFTLSEATVAKIGRCMESILHRKACEGITFFDCQDNHRVFALDLAPEYIFKLATPFRRPSESRDDSMRARFLTIRKAIAVCKTHQLSLLIIPKGKLYRLKIDGVVHDLLVEERLEIDSGSDLGTKYGSSLNEAVRQLARFVCLTGFSDVEWRNTPVLKERTDSLGNRMLALIDIEEMESEVVGLFGIGLGHSGLIGCVSEEQRKIVLEVAQEHGVDTKWAQKYKVDDEPK